MTASTLLRSLLLLLALVGAATLSAARSAAAQPTRPDSAAVLFAAAEDFANRGADDMAEALYRHILERFPGTAAAESARARLEDVSSRESVGLAGGAIAARRDITPGTATSAMMGSLWGTWLPTARR